MLTSVTERGGSMAAAALRAAVQGRFDNPIAVGEKPRRRRSRDAETRWVTAALSGLALLICSGAGGLALAPTILLVASGAALAGYSAWKLVPR
jgi:hypothetical protein